MNCPLCGDSMDPMKGEQHNWMRVIWRIKDGPWRVSLGPPWQRRLAVHYEPEGLERATAHASCAEPLVEEAKANPPTDGPETVYLGPWLPDDS